MVDFETQYLNLLEDILTNGERRADRTGTGTIGVFSRQLRIDLQAGFPLLTTKKVPFKSVLSELLWFMEGSGDERRLAEILHGTRDDSKKTIWSPNAEGTTGAKYKPQFKGDLGRVYGVQWRTWAKPNGEHVDQLAEVIHKLKNNPTDRRIILSAWNPGELDLMALPPCHMFAQFYRSNDGRIDCKMYQRSVDTFLGLPFNIASYATLVHIIANEVGGYPGILTMDLGDTHIYLDHVDQVREQLSRVPLTEHGVSELRIRDTPWTDLTMADFDLVNYVHHDPIKARMSA